MATPGADIYSRFKYEDSGFPYLDLDAVLKKYPNIETFKKKDGSWDVNKVFDFLDALGIKMSRTEDVIKTMEEGNPDLNNRPEFHILKTLLK